MKSLLLSVCAAAALLVSCTSSPKKVAEADDVEIVNPVEGRWSIDRVQLSDSAVLVIDTAVMAEQFVEFNADSTYVVLTNCNSISGAYALNGDSITLADGAMTEMACDDMRAEDMLRVILPQISAYAVDGDSLRLSAAGQMARIELHRAH